MATSQATEVFFTLFEEPDQDAVVGTHIDPEILAGWKHEGTPEAEIEKYLNDNKEHIGKCTGKCQLLLGFYGIPQKLRPKYNEA